MYTYLGTLNYWSIMFDKNVDKTSMLMNNAHNRAFDI